MPASRAVFLIWRRKLLVFAGAVMLDNVPEGALGLMLTILDGSPWQPPTDLLQQLERQSPVFWD
jgi:hypothetical protein